MNVALIILCILCFVVTWSVIGFVYGLIVESMHFIGATKEPMSKKEIWWCGPLTWYAYRRKKK